MSLRSCWILEDEPPALRRLQGLLAQVAPNLEVTFATDTVTAARQALEKRTHPDLVFSDIHLADGLCFALWESVPVAFPIVFTTAYDQYGIRAFRTNGIDYLLKPVEEDALSQSLAKLERLRQPAFPPDWEALTALLTQQRTPRVAYRERFLLQHRQDWITVPVSELRQFYSTDGMSFAVAHDAKRYLLEGSLNQLVEELDPGRWLRINRGQIVHIEAVRKVSPYFNHRLVLELHPTGEGDGVVSRSRVGACRAWLGSRG